MFRASRVLLSVALLVVAPAGARAVAATPGPRIVFAASSIFVPGGVTEVVVNQGDHLSFVNLDAFEHNIVGDGNTFRSPKTTVLKHEVVDVEGVADLAPDRYTFSCEVHPFMTGVLVVE